MSTVLEVQDLSVRFGTVEAFAPLSFHVARGSSWAIIGPNGAGKTVLLKALIGAVPYSGTIRWAPDTRLGYVPQKLDIERDLPLSGADFLGAKAALTNSSREQVLRALDAVGLDADALSRPIGGLSGGQFQRLLVAFALLGEPDVLLLDEPAAGVDAPGQAQLDEVIHGLRDTRDLTVLLVSHDLSVVYRYADQVLCLGRRHACVGSPHTTLTPQLLSELYGSPIGLHVHDAP